MGHAPLASCDCNCSEASWHQQCVVVPPLSKLSPTRRLPAAFATELSHVGMQMIASMPATVVSAGCWPVLMVAHDTR